MKAKTKEHLSESSAQFLDGLAQKTRGLADHIDTQTNVLIGVSSAIFLFSVSRILEEEAPVLFLVLGFFAGLSALVGLFAIHPPAFMRKQGQEESLLYNKHIAGFASPKEYTKRLNEIIDNKQDIVQQYATEIYNLSKFYYRPKRKLFHMSRNILLTGIFAAFVSFLLDLSF